MRVLRPGIVSRKRDRPFEPPPPTFTQLVDIHNTAVSAPAVLSGTDLIATVTLPTGITAGMDILVVCSTKLYDSKPLPPAGWRRIDTVVGFMGSSGGDRGVVVMTLFQKTATGSESSQAVAFTVPSGSSALCTAYVIKKDVLGTLHYKISPSARNKPDITQYKARSWNPIDVEKDDLMLCVTCINTDTWAWDTQALTVDTSPSGYNVMNAEVLEAPTSVGNDQEQFASTYRIVTPCSGHWTVTARPVGSTTIADNPIGGTFFIRIRQKTESFTWWPSGLRVQRGNEIENLSDDVPSLGEGKTIFQAQRISMEGPDPIANRYQLVTKGGRKAVKFVCNFVGGAVNRRTEYSTSPWLPQYPRGTHFVEEICWETDDWPNNPLNTRDGSGNPIPGANPTTEWDLQQNHPGGAPGFSSNSPLYFFGFSHAGQVGWDNLPGASAGGEFVIVISSLDNTGNYLRYRFPTILWGPNKQFRLRHHIKADFGVDDPTPGTPCLKVWMNDVLIFQNYTHPTVYKTDAERGTNSLVLGASKKGIYHQGIQNETQRAATVAAGHYGLQVYSVCQKHFFVFPTDIEYAAMNAALTNNNSPWYSYVSTLGE